LTHPTPPRDGSNFLRAIGCDWPIEGSKQTAPPSGGVMICRMGELEERDVGERRRLLHEPSFAAHCDAIAGRK
jgi:hypothetical protein